MLAIRTGLAAAICDLDIPVPSRSLPSKRVAKRTRAVNALLPDVENITGDGDRVTTDANEVMHVRRSHPERGRLLHAVAAACLLLAAYWLTASGTFHSVDEHLVFATARNLVYHGKFDQSTLFWGSPYTDLGMVGLDGELYSKYGIGHSILVAL